MLLNIQICQKECSEYRHHNLLDCVLDMHGNYWEMSAFSPHFCAQYFTFLSFSQSSWLAFIFFIDFTTSASITLILLLCVGIVKASCFTHSFIDFVDCAISFTYVVSWYLNCRLVLLLLCQSLSWQFSQLLQTQLSLFCLVSFYILFLKFYLNCLKILFWFSKDHRVMK